jgi:SRSO17 transposase
MKTYTPELSPSVLGRLADYAASFAADFPQTRPALWTSAYLQGLLLDGERKSIEPLSRRVTLPDELAVKGPEQAVVVQFGAPCLQLQGSKGQTVPPPAGAVA